MATLVHISGDCITTISLTREGKQKNIIKCNGTALDIHEERDFDEFELDQLKEREEEAENDDTEKEDDKTEGEAFPKACEGKGPAAFPDWARIKFNIAFEAAVGRVADIPTELPFLNALDWLGWKLVNSPDTIERTYKFDFNRGRLRQGRRSVAIPMCGSDAGDWDCDSAMTHLSK